jgi:hypothetical protein
MRSPAELRLVGRSPAHAAGEPGVTCGNEAGQKCKAQMQVDNSGNVQEKGDRVTSANVAALCMLCCWQKFLLICNCPKHSNAAG